MVICGCNEKEWAFVAIYGMISVYPSQGNALGILLLLQQKSCLGTLGATLYSKEETPKLLKIKIAIASSSKTIIK